jgi:hypothetical protein
MSGTKRNWIILILVLIVIVLIFWWKGLFNKNYTIMPAANATSTQAAKDAVSSSAVTNKSTGNPNLDQIDRDVANMNSQFQLSLNQLANIGSTPSQAKIFLVASSLKYTALLMTQLNTELQSAIINSKLTKLDVNMKDMGIQLSDSTSQLGAVLNNTKNIASDATTANNTVLLQALAQLKKAKTYLQAAGNDVTKVVSGLK